MVIVGVLGLWCKRGSYFVYCCRERLERKRVEGRRREYRKGKEGERERER